MKVKYAYLGIVLIALVYPAFGWAAEELVLSLDEAVAIGLRDNRDIILKQEDIHKAQAKLREARAARLPGVTLSGGWSVTSGYYAKDHVSQTQAQGEVTQVLYQGGKIINTIGLNELGVRITEAILDKTRLETVFAVQKAFYTLLLAEDFVQLNQKLLDNTRAHLLYEKERYKQGEASHADILALESSISSIAEACEHSKNQREAAHIVLNTVLFLTPDLRIKVQGVLTYEAKEIMYDEAFLKALAQRPEIRQAQFQGDAAKKSVEIARAGSRPSILASGDYYSRSHTVTVGGLNRNWNDYSVLGLTVSWPIFDGWATKAKVDQALIELKQAVILKEKTVRDVASDLKNSYLALNDSLAKIKSTEAALVMYADNLASAEKKYRSGIASGLEKNDADVKHAVAFFNREQAVYEYLISKFSFEKATGGM